MDKTNPGNGDGSPRRFPFQDNPVCEKVLRLFSLCSNEYRFKLLCMLAEDEFCVQDMVTALEAKYSNISQQLKILMLAGYVEKERRERQTFYKLKSEEVRDLLAFLKGQYL